MEFKDSAIKLFGKEIPLPTKCEIQPIAEDDSTSSSVIKMDIQEEREKQGHKDTADKDSTSEKAAEAPVEREDDLPENSDDTFNSESLADGSTDPKIDEETAKEKSSKTEKEQNDSGNSLEKPLKKPDKILPCPRCNSMDTKFCYYNNYNVNQPRHFCKACQRYWTAGGTMRNVPVGAGRRKNKNYASQYRHIAISETLEAARIDAANGMHLPASKCNGRVLNFSLDAPICDSMASVLNLTDKKVTNGTRNGYHSFEEQRIPVPCRGKEYRDDCSNGSSVTVSTSTEDIAKTHTKESSFPAIKGYPAQIPCLPGLPWPYPWNSAAPRPGFYSPELPLPFYPAPLWNCGVPSNWNIHWLSPSCRSQNSPSSSPNSTLGKHSREGDMLKLDTLEKEDSPRPKNGCVLVPKTLRVDDPSDAAKSSIWATLGIKNEAASGGGMFKSLQPKSDNKNRAIDASPVLMANPAALSRSLHFRESS